MASDCVDRTHGMCFTLNVYYDIRLIGERYFCFGMGSLRYLPYVRI